MRLMHASANASNVLLVTVMGRRKMMKIEKIVKKKFGYRVALPHMACNTVAPSAPGYSIFL